MSASGQLRSRLRAVSRGRRQPATLASGRCRSRWIRNLSGALPAGGLPQLRKSWIRTVAGLLHPAQVGSHLRPGAPGLESSGPPMRTSSVPNASATTAQARQPIAAGRSSYPCCAVRRQPGPSCPSTVLDLPLSWAARLHDRGIARHLIEPGWRPWVARPICRYPVRSRPFATPQVTMSRTIAKVQDGALPAGVRFRDPRGGAKAALVAPAPPKGLGSPRERGLMPSLWWRPGPWRAQGVVGRAYGLGRPWEP